MLLLWWPLFTIKYVLLPGHKIPMDYKTLVELFVITHCAVGTALSKPGIYLNQRAVTS